MAANRILNPISQVQIALLEEISIWTTHNNLVIISYLMELVIIT
jgi:hypothetical protein